MHMKAILCVIVAVLTTSPAWPNGDENSKEARKPSRITRDDPAVKQAQIPELPLWEKNMLAFGRKHGEFFVAQQDAKALDPALAACYYDAIRVCYNRSPTTPRTTLG